MKASAVPAPGAALKDPLRSQQKRGAFGRCAAVE
jgi:hypothetical protein